MMTAVDTNVLLDVLTPDSAHSEASAAALRRAYYGGGLCISAAVCAELTPHFDSRRVLEEFLTDFGLMILPDTADVAWEAGSCWAAYRRSGGPRGRILTDFLIGAHAFVHADCLLTRDRGFYRQCFADLKVVEP